MVEVEGFSGGTTRGAESTGGSSPSFCKEDGVRLAVASSCSLPLDEGAGEAAG